MSCAKHSVCKEDSSLLESDDVSLDKWVPAYQRDVWDHLPSNTV